MGHSDKRKEDARLIRGQGNYVDDVGRPGMVYMDIVRSPYAHAKIKSIIMSIKIKFITRRETLKERLVRFDSDAISKV